MDERKTILVNGASRGMGLEFAMALLEGGKRVIVLTKKALVLSAIVSIAAIAFAADARPTGSGRAIVFNRCTLIDGTGAGPIRNAVVIVESGRIIAVGGIDSAKVPMDALVFDLDGAFVLPGFINAHVHYAFDEERLKTWAAAGVTSVRDMGSLGLPVEDVMKWRAESRKRPEYTRIFAVGPMISVRGGYGSLFVSSTEDARRAADELIDRGVDAIKASLEDGYAGTTGLKKLSDGELLALIETARSRGKRTSVHITQARYLRQAVLAGADEIAHIAYDYVDQGTWEEAVSRGVTLLPTFTVFRNYGAPISTCVFNLRNFLSAGGIVALGNDYGGGPGEFEGGIPMYELSMMKNAGMSPMQVIVASTMTAAICCGAGDSLGTIEPGKIADILAVREDPLEDLAALKEPVLVMKEGVVIVDMLRHDAFVGD